MTSSNFRTFFVFNFLSWIRNRIRIECGSGSRRKNECGSGIHSPGYTLLRTRMSRLESSPLWASFKFRKRRNSCTGTLLFLSFLFAAFRLESRQLIFLSRFFRNLILFFSSVKLKSLQFCRVNRERLCLINTDQKPSSRQKTET